MNNSTTAAALAGPSEAVKRLNPHVFGGGVISVGGAPQSQPGANVGVQVGRIEACPTHRLNRTEEKFAYFLRSLPAVTWISDHDAIKLRLADGKCFYTPDFASMDSSGRLTFWEVKGFWRDDARVKIKVAARIYSWASFIAVSWKRGQWNFELIGGPSMEVKILK